MPISRNSSPFLFIKRLKVKVSPFPPFRELMLPKSLLWYYLIVLILSIMAPEEGDNFIYGSPKPFLHF
ncbi:DUF2232 domain-containing protein [Bacillus sp. m3-13]|uniref:DUF2232 domain-containing protein n=1 Tax=Bacillus sp. m3-13 TaxID=406124 RepID=UPI0009FC4205